MENFNLEKYQFGESKTFKDYILLFRNNLKYFFIITPVILMFAFIYAFTATEIYVSTATIRITKSEENILENNRQSYDAGFVDRFITNEIVTMTDYEIREKIAQVLIDSFQNAKNRDFFSIVRSEDRNNNFHKSVEDLASELRNMISAEQYEKTDMVNISAESPSPLEAAIIANSCATEYYKLNLVKNREKLTNIRKFLEQQREEKFVELQSADDTLMKFQAKAGIVSLDVQSTDLINQLSDLDAQKEVAKIELMTSNEVLRQYKFFLQKQDPQLVDYLENQTSQAYINALQQQLADLQVNRDMVLSIKSPNVDISGKVNEYDQRIKELQDKLNAAISSIKANAFSGNPAQVQDLAQKMIEEEIKNNTLSVRLKQLEAITGKYEGNLKKLPKTSTELSQLKRNRDAIQQMYLLINEKYQEAVINEVSQPGNVTILSLGGIPNNPVKPNRKILLILGLVLGLGLTFAFIIIKDYFDDTIKTPEDIEKKGYNFLSWVPHFDSDSNNFGEAKELVTLFEPDSPTSESFRAIRARILHSRIDSEFAKMILVTSPAQSEGKTFVAANLAGIFAKSNKKTLLIDCDLRRPRIHSLLGMEKKPGIVDYLDKTAHLEEIIRSTRNNNLSFISSGSIPSNPAEILESDSFREFLLEIRDFFDTIIIDSPPIIAVIDAEILSKLVDGTILVISADKTETRLMKEASQLLNKKNASFLGLILNNFKYKSGYGYYYKYHYNYTSHSNSKGRKKIRIKS